MSPPAERPPGVRTGVMLPTFNDSPDRAMAVALEAEATGVDGVFCYDHLWPLGDPDRPAMVPFPVLAAVASVTRRLIVGTLVARVGLVPDELLVAQFTTLAAVAPGRVVAGLGTGDRLSAAENHAYGVAFERASARRAALSACATELVAAGLPVWIGGGARATLLVAEQVGAAVNLWDRAPGEVAAQAARTEVTWAGPAPVAPLHSLVDRMAAAGATWVVLGWPAPLADLAAAGARHRGM